MKKAVITLAAALAFGTSLAAFAQDQDPNELVIIPDQQPAGSGRRAIRQEEKEEG